MKALGCLLFLPLSPLAEAQDRFTIESIDMYGLLTIPEDEVRAQLPFGEGDTVQPELVDIPDAVAARLGVARVESAVVCCSDSGAVVVYVGVEEIPDGSRPWFAGKPAKTDLRGIR